MPRDRPPCEAAASGQGLSVLSLPTGLQDSLSDPEDVLDRERCLETLAALRHAKWFQVRTWGGWGGDSRQPRSAH